LNLFPGIKVLDLDRFLRDCRRALRMFYVSRPLEEGLFDYKLRIGLIINYVCALFLISRG
jgi:hypothetical protein